MENNAKCMPTPPKRVGREFVRQYYTIMNKSPENLHCFYSEEAKFIHDDVNPAERRTITADGKKAIRDIMIERSPNFKHTSTKIHTVDTIETLDEGLLVQVNGEISFNEQPMRPFSQTIILIPKSPFQYFVQNDIFRFSDYEHIPKSRCNSVTDQTMPSVQSDWGTQCEEEYNEQYEEQMAKQSEPRVDSDCGDTQENEVKLDTSDSGLSSDAEKAIMDIQSNNLRNILQEPKSITKESVMNRVPTPPALSENEPSTESDANPVEDTNRTQLFRDSCILTVGNVINPNIEFDDTNLGSEKTNESVDTLNASKSDDNSSGKVRYRKRKDKRKVKNEMSKEKSIDESVENNKEVETNQSSENNGLTETAAAQSENAAPENTVEETPIDKSSEPTMNQSTMRPSEQETPKTIPEIKTYADLAKAGPKTEWIDELAVRRDSTDRNKTRPTLVRRSSKTEKTTPSHDAGNNSRSSPKNDLLQVFIGNIPHSATEDDIRKMFSRFGRLVRLRLHSNTRKEWLPRYAFITYENLQSVKQCLMKKSTFYWPENSPDGQKLNVNGDPTVDIWDDSGNQKPSETNNRGRDFKQFSRNFVLENNKESNKRSPDSDSNISDTVKSERRKTSTRA